jgi:2-polyprenyl-6-methoxyphenol hydroxylase-like FAD-dependent oxidoreductase
MAHVIVVGAGPAGASLAYLLASRGVEVSLVERQSDFSREFRGEVLMPSGIDALRQMGLERAFEALPRARPTRVNLHLNGRLARSIDLPRLVGETPQTVSQPAMLEMLVEQARPFPGFRMLRGVAVNDLLCEGGRTTGVTLGGDMDGELRADLVVGADGRGSRVRKRAGLEVERDVETFDVVWFKIPPPPQSQEIDATAHAFVRAGQFALAIPTFDGRLQVGWVIPKGRFGELRSFGVDHWIEKMSFTMGPVFGEHIRRHRRDVEHPFVLNVVCYCLERWTAPGLLLLGDAAHPMSPVGGQGLNIALRDSVVAANHLLPVLECRAPDADSLDAAARAIENERRVEVTRIEKLQRLPPRFFFRDRWWVHGMLELGARLLQSRAFDLLARPPRITQTFLHGVTKVQLRV